MKVTEHIKAAKKTLFSFEILPPLKGESIQSVFETIDPLMEFKPPFIDVTYHREEYVFKKRENGLLEKRSIRKRPGTVGICAAIMNRFQIDAVPHIICGGFTVEETENALIDLHFLGIDNVLLLRGDAIKSEGRFTPEPNGHAYASDLIQQVVKMNNGSYLDEDIQNTISTNFCIGVAGYPEKHSEAANLKTDLKYLKQKIELGANYIVTQMFFDNEKYFQFKKSCLEAGITIPIVPGLKVIKNTTQLKTIPKTFSVDLPEVLVDEIIENPEHVEEIGSKWAYKQVEELVSHGEKNIHFYIMNDANLVVDLVKKFKAL